MVNVFILCFPVAMVSAEDILETFEQGNWVGQPLGEYLSSDAQTEIEDWTLSKGNSANKIGISLEQDPYHVGGKSIFIQRPNGWASGDSVISKTFDPISKGAEVSFRFTTPQTFGGSGHFFKVCSSNDKNVVNFGCDTTDGNSFTGKDWLGNDLTLGTWSYSFGLYFDNNNRPNGSYINKLPVSEDGRLSYVRIDPIAYKYFIWEERYVKFVFDCENKQVDIYYDIDPIVAQQPVATVPFIDMTAEDIGKIEIGGYSGAYGGMYYDDILISDSGLTPPKPVVPYTVTEAVYTPINQQITVKADVTKGSKPSGVVFAAAYNVEGELIGLSQIQTITSDTSYENTFDVSGEVASTRVFVWSDMNSAQPRAQSVDAERKDPPPPPGPSVLNETFDDGEWTSQPIGKALNTSMIFGDNPEKEHTRGENTIINGWVLQGQDYTGSNFQLVNDPLDGENKVLLVSMSSNPDWHDSGLKATKEFDPITDTAVFSYRITVGSTSNSARNHFIQLFDNNIPIITFGGGYCGENYTGIGWNDKPLTLGRWCNYFGLYYDTTFPSVEKDLNKYEEVDGKLPYVMLGSRYPNTTAYVKMVLHFDSKTIDIYYSGEPITDQTEITATVPFLNSNADSVNKLILGGGNYARDYSYWDDISVSKAGE